jgi:hypothetical protein
MYGNRSLVGKAERKRPLGIWMNNIKMNLLRNMTVD